MSDTSNMFCQLFTYHRRLFKEACRLHKAVAPSAMVHSSRDVRKLQEHALAVEVLVKHVEEVASDSSDMTFPWMEDWKSFKMADHVLAEA